MRSIPISILILSFLFISLNANSQTGDFFTLRGVIHNNTANSTVIPSAVEVDTKGGFLEVSVNFSQGCIEKYRFEFQFDQDMSSLRAGESYGFSYHAKLISGQCNHNRNGYIRPGAPLGASSGLVATSGYADIVNAIGVDGSARTYNKDLGKPNVYNTARMRGTFIPKTHKLNAHTWLNFILSAPSNLPGQSFNYEILYIYQITEDKPAEVFSCPPPDCSGFPGTVPVWNFETNQGECWCPEGTLWDKMKQKCVVVSIK